MGFALNFILRALRQKYLDLKFKTSGVSVQVIERPGLWMSPARRETLQADLRQIAQATLAQGALDYGIFAKDSQPLARSTITLLRDPKTQKPIAFNALAHIEVAPGGKSTHVTHLGLVMVDPGVQSKGLSWILYGLTCVLLFLRRGFRPIYISNVTQVPAVVGMVSETFSRVEPNPRMPQPQDFRKVQIARQIMADHRHVFGVGPEAEFDDTDFIIRNAYTGGSDDLKKSFAAAAKHRDPIYNDWCAQTLDYQRGDDVLQIGLIDLAAARTYVRRSVPKGSMLSLALLGATILLQRAVVPALQWFDTTREFGSLRPR